MLEADLITLIQKIQHNQCDFQTIEVIAANTNTPRLYETLSSFSNQDNGGIIVLGLNETDFNRWSYRRIYARGSPSFERRFSNKSSKSDGL